MDLDHPNICCCLIDSPTRQPGGHFFSSAGEPMDLAHVATPIYPIIQVVDDGLVLKPMVARGSPIFRHTKWYTVRDNKYIYVYIYIYDEITARMNAHRRHCFFHGATT